MGAVSALRDKLVWDEGVSTRVKHSLGVILHKRHCLHMKIAKHFIQMLMADDVDDVRVNFS